ncbi:MAG: hypothetical protein AB9846_08155 [Tenuifilaceae bacterium]
MMNILFKSKIVESLIILTLILVLSGCKCNRDNQTIGKEFSQEVINDSIPYPGIIFLLPSPSEVLSIIINNDIAYNENLLAPLNIDKNAINSEQQALILGAYFTDLSYNIIYKNYHTATKNINSIQNLSQNLGIAYLFNDQYFKRIENNITNIDSINAIFNDFTNNSFNVIQSTGNNEMLSVIAMGSGIEAMYLSFISDSLKNIDKNLIPKFLGQKVIFDNYFKNFLNYNHNKPELKSFISDIKIIYSLIQHKIVINFETTVNEGREANITIKDRPTSTINEKGIRELGDSIIIVRNKLINLKYQ